MPDPACPHCGTPLRQIDHRPGREAYACPVALQAQQRGFIGQPGRKHDAVYVFTASETNVSQRSAGNGRDEGAAS